MTATVRPYFAGGHWASSGEEATIRAPWDGAEVARIHRASHAGIDAAITSARAAFEAAREDFPTHRRVAVLDAIAAGISARRDEIARQIVAEAGKPIRHASAEVARAILTFRTAAEEARHLGGEVLDLDLTPAAGRRLGIVRRFPIGVLLGISPFNFPLNLVAHKVAPALAAGNAIVLRPASQTPLSALTLAAIAEAARCPPGMLAVVPSSVPAIEPFIGDPRVAGITFTGSPEVGWPIREHKARRARVTLELGGNAAAIIDEGVALDETLMRRIAEGCFAFAGQVCIKLQRLIVHRSLVARFTEMLAAATAATPTGDPSSPDTICGPLVSPAEAVRVRDWIAEAESGGARRIVGGERPADALVTPCLLDRVAPDMRVVASEIFGPVAVIEPFDTFDEALALVNASRYGLQAALFTNHLDHTLRAYRRLDVGGLIVNDVPGFRIDPMPYGGVKESGLGREGVRYAIEEMTERKLVVLDGF